MTNEELRTKIVEILEETEYEWTEEKNGYILQIFYDKLADALIAAGIVDKSDYASMKETAVRYKAEVSKAEAKAKEADRRAEVAEKAFSNCIENFVKFQYEQKSIQLDNVFLDKVIKKCLQQAEKELAEEGKDD